MACLQNGHQFPKIIQHGNSDLYCSAVRFGTLKFESEPFNLYPRLPPHLVFGGIWTPNTNTQNTSKTEVSGKLGLDLVGEHMGTACFSSRIPVEMGEVWELHRCESAWQDQDAQLIYPRSTRYVACICRQMDSFFTGKCIGKYDQPHDFRECLRVKLFLLSQFWHNPGVNRSKPTKIHHEHPLER